MDFKPRGEFGVQEKRKERQEANKPVLDLLSKVVVLLCCIQYFYTSREEELLPALFLEQEDWFLFFLSPRVEKGW